MEMPYKEKEKQDFFISYQICNQSYACYVFFN